MTATQARDTGFGRSFGAADKARAAECAYFRGLLARPSRSPLNQEPKLEELLADPDMHLLMRRDGVSLPALRNLLAEAESRLARRLCGYALA